MITLNTHIFHPNKAVEINGQYQLPNVSFIGTWQQCFNFFLLLFSKRNNKKNTYCFKATIDVIKQFLKKRSAYDL